MFAPMIKVILVKQNPYRGKPEEWSNGYYLSGPAPSTPAAWDALLNACKDAERPANSSATSYVHAYGYLDPEGHADRGLLWDGNLAANQGSMPSLSGATTMAGDQAACIRFRVGQNVKGRPRYLFKYIHFLTDTPGDALNPDRISRLQAAFEKFRDGTLSGTYKLGAPDGTLAGSPEVIPWKTTRTLKRRGKRPPRP